MKFVVSEDKNFLVLNSSTQLELEQLEISFTKKVDNWFIIKKKRPSWDGEVAFIDRYNRIPIGLWQEIQKLSKEYKFPLHIDGTEYLYDKEFKVDDFDNWWKEYFKDSNITPRDYQIEAAKRAIKFKKCTEEISTSGGKTLIAFMIFKYLYDRKKIKKLLYIVPNLSLVTQSEEKFYEYEEKVGKKPDWLSDCVYGGAKVPDYKSNITFGTYQSLSKKELDYFSEFDAVIIDETHHAKANSIKNILLKCYNSDYKIGLTGTLPQGNSCDSFTIQAYIGPKVYTVHSADLIEAGNATPIHVIGIELDYANEEIKKKLYQLRTAPTDEKKEGSFLLNLEKEIARDNRKRFNYIVSTISKASKNSLVLFSDIKNGYGRKFFDWLKENTDKTVYYIDGGTNGDNREYYKKQMEQNDDVIIVASMGTFSEGIDILNLHSIFIIESYKSEFIVRQILGRGMRLMEGKEVVKVFDFSDNFLYGNHKWQKVNYLIRHGRERAKIYKEKRFPYKLFKVKL